MISKTFLFIGFSFADPNIDYILSRIRIDYGENKRQHYALMRKIKENEYKNKADYEYAERKHQFFVEDLKRYNICALMIDEYDEITEVLEEISRRLNNDNIFVSGSAAEYGDYEEKEAVEFIHQLSNRLIREEYNIISGFGLGVGSAVITGALQEIYMRRKTINESRLLLRPFPQGIENDDKRQKLWRKYREDMISRAGISIFLFGNKFEAGKIVLANGMKSEFQIANEQHNLIVPIGCTGYMAKEIWEEVNKDLTEYYNKVDEELKEIFAKLNSKVDNNTLIDIVLKFINSNFAHRF